MHFYRLYRCQKVVPVGCVGIDNGQNAAYLAMRILAIKYPELNDKL